MEEYWLLPSGMSIFQGDLLISLDRSKSSLLRWVAGFVGWEALLSCSDAGSVAIGMAEQWWLRSKSAGGRCPRII